MACRLGAFDGADPPEDLIHRIIQRETETQKAESRYTYRQTVTVEEYDSRGMKGGEYREVRDILFSPAGVRGGEFIGKPRSTLARIRLTDEDFRDLREVQPFQLTADQARLYETRFRGEETVLGLDCWVLQLRPRQILDGQRLFDGLIWVSKNDASIVQSSGQAVPQILNTHSENLFPRFTTIRERIEGFWFPVTTIGDDVLEFRGGPQRMRLSIRYENYKRFDAESKITFEK